MDRRGFLMALLAAALFPWRVAMAERKVLPRGFPRDKLKFMNPAEVDASALEIDPIEGFGVMGTVMDVPVEGYRLKVHGKVGKALDLTLQDLLSLPKEERAVLLICPGFFAYKALWQGVDLLGLLKIAGMADDAKGVRIRGADGFQDTFSPREVEGAKMLLAHGVNGVPLPKKHGFPVRLVAEGLYGERWVKYVTEVEVL